MTFPQKYQLRTQHLFRSEWTSKAEAWHLVLRCSGKCKLQGPACVFFLSLSLQSWISQNLTGIQRGVKWRTVTNWWSAGLGSGCAVGLMTRYPTNRKEFSTLSISCGKSCGRSTNTRRLLPSFTNIFCYMEGGCIQPQIYRLSNEKSTDPTTIFSFRKPKVEVKQSMRVSCKVKIYK